MNSKFIIILIIILIIFNNSYSDIKNSKNIKENYYPDGGTIDQNLKKNNEFIGKDVFHHMSNVLSLGNIWTRPLMLEPEFLTRAYNKAYYGMFDKNNSLRKTHLTMVKLLSVEELALVLYQREKRRKMFNSVFPMLLDERFYYYKNHKDYKKAKKNGSLREYYNKIYRNAINQNLTGSSNVIKTIQKELTVEEFNAFKKAAKFLKKAIKDVPENEYYKSINDAGFKENISVLFKNNFSLDDQDLSWNKVDVFKNDDNSPLNKNF